MHPYKNFPEEIGYWNAMVDGDKHAFAKIYELYFKVLYNYGRKICSDTCHVEDSIHDLFVDLWRFRQNLSATTSVRFYLYRSLRRRLVKSTSQRFMLHDSHAFIEDVLQFSTHSQEYEIIESESADHLRNQIQKLFNDLSPRQYEALALYFYDEFSYSEIASILDVKEQSARNLVQRGLAQLRDYGRHIASISF